MPKVVPVPDDAYARQMAEVEARCVQFEVTGDCPIRDAVSRESIDLGGIVRLDPATTNIDTLISAHAIRPVDTSAAKPAATPES